MTNSADPEKPTDLYLHCLQSQDISGFSRTRVNQIVLIFFSLETNENVCCVYLIGAIQKALLKRSYPIFTLSIRTDRSAQKV